MKWNRYSQARTFGASAARQPDSPAPAASQRDCLVRLRTRPREDLFSVENTSRQTALLRQIEAFTRNIPSSRSGDALLCSTAVPAKQAAASNAAIAENRYEWAMPGTKELLGNRGGLSDSETCSVLITSILPAHVRTPPAGKSAAFPPMRCSPRWGLKASGFCFISRRKDGEPQISMVPDDASGCRLRRRRVLLVPAVLVPVPCAVEGSAGE